MKQHRDFEFNLRELAGSLGDFGTLLPLAIGLIVVNGVDPAGLLIMLGLSNIALGLIYRLPMPLQPKKVVAAAAIAQGWPSSLVYASGLGLGVVWIVLALTGLLERLVRVTPLFVVRGIQLALGLLLAGEALKLMKPSPVLAVVGLVLVLLLRGNRYAPSSLVIVGLGLALITVRHGWEGAVELRLSLPPLTLPQVPELWKSLVLVGLAQITLSVTNAVLATAALIRDYFPERVVTERRLMLNMGVMNIAGSVFGGIPLCHGAGGLASQYAFGARTGGASILEGVLEILLGLFLSSSVTTVMSLFPMALVGAMLLWVSLQLARPSLGLEGWQLALALVTAVLSVITNMTLGFGAGLAGAYLVRFLKRRGFVGCLCSRPNRLSSSRE